MSRAFVQEFTRAFPDLHRQLELYLASLPPGVDAMTHGFNRVNSQLRRVAVFPMLSLPNAGSPNLPVHEAGQLIGVEVHESLHRFLMRTRPAAGDDDVMSQVVSKRPLAQAKVRWHLAPDDYVGGPGEIPPPTPFRPHRSQAFVMEGHFLFDDEQRSGLHGFALGRTYPAMVNGKPELRLAAMVQVLEGYGAFFGQIGQVGINGVVQPPEFMHLAVVPSFHDFQGHLVTRHAIEALPSQPDPAKDELFFLIRAEIDPHDPMEILPQPRGLLLAPADLPFCLLESDFQTSPRLVSHSTAGPEIGIFHTKFWVGPLTSATVCPFQSIDSFYIFRDLGGRSLGEISADVLVGRTRSLSLPGLRTPAFQFAGIGPIEQGHGVFEGATGFITTIGTMTIFPRAMSVVYIVRIVDPDGRYREATHKAWNLGPPVEGAESTDPPP